MVVVSPIGLRPHHSPAGGGQVLRAKFRQTDQLIPRNVSRIARQEKCDVRVAFSPAGDVLEAVTQSLRTNEAHNSSSPAELGPEPLLSQLIQQSLYELRCGRIKTRKELPPEHG